MRGFLSSNDAPNRGIVEVKVDGVWGTICQDGFHKDNAHVICRQLGYPSGDAILGLDTVTFFYRNDVMHIYELDCSGDENNIAYCPYSNVLREPTDFSGMLNCRCCMDITTNVAGVECDTTGTVSKHSWLLWSFYLYCSFLILTQYTASSPIFQKKGEIFTSAETFRYIIYVCKIFLANPFV